MSVNIHNDRLAPKWLRDLLRLLPIRSQFVLSGNIRDLFLLPKEGGYDLLPLHDCLRSALSQKGFPFMVRFNLIDGITLSPDTNESREAAKQFGITLKGNAMPVNLDNLSTILRAIVDTREQRVSMVLDYASRIARSPQQLGENEHRFFMACEKLASDAKALYTQESALFNPLIWLVNRPQDLPTWYGLGDSRIHCVEIPKPSQEQRLEAARRQISQFGGYEQADDTARRGYAGSFATMTDGFTLRNMVDVAVLGRSRNLAVTEIEDAVRSYKTGDPTLDNPWRSPRLKEKIRQAEGRIRERVLGQDEAVRQTLDIVKRSVMSLTGAHVNAGRGRPRGVLFFAGPTGVGKTELAKSLTRELFGDEQAYHRFDMSEFSAEHAAARLLGAPPGYVGYEGGGELTNAVRQRPFSVILFDEVEKAHGRILDKFLQILEDGRLTDGRGDTVYFSESIIVFTSNLGIVRAHGVDVPEVVVTPETSYDVVREKVKAGIDEYFRLHLGRPELLNRLGNNIVVFDFIRPNVASDIFGKMIENIRARVRSEHDTDVQFSDDAMTSLRTWCLRDLSNGGRGIGSALETALINPLARALFEEDDIRGKKIEVTQVRQHGQHFVVELRTHGHRLD